MLCCTLLFACARPVPLTGGDKDTQAPKVLKEKSTKNYQTNFSKQSIELTFDEWVVLKDVAKQVLISPPLGRAFNPARDVKLKGRTVSVNFQEAVELRDSTTYTINFGTAIQDLTVGNPAEDMRFVFSTGPYLDSLSLEGNVVDAFTGEAEKKAAIMLYEANAPDSVVKKGLPYYYALCNESGNFSLQNLSSGNYRIIAIEENFVNQRWDGNERIGFYEKTISLPDSTKQRPSIRLFSEQKAFAKTGQSATQYGYAWMAYNADPDSLLPPRAPTGVELFHIVSQDTVYMHYRNPPDSMWYLILGKDSLQVRPRPDSIFFAENPLDVAQASSAKSRSSSRSSAKPKKEKKKARPVTTKSLQSSQIAQIRFNRPLAALDTAFLALELDSTRLPLPIFSIDSIDRRKINIQYPWRAGQTYTFSMFPNAIEDWYGQKTKDTVVTRLSIVDSSQLSNLEVSLDSFILGTSYFIELTKDGKKVDYSARLNPQDSSNTVYFNSIRIAPYTLRVIEDKNANQRWDAGSFDAKRQPERIFSKKVESLKPNWSVKTNILLLERKGGKPSTRELQKKKDKEEKRE